MELTFNKNCKLISKKTKNSEKFELYKLIRSFAREKRTQLRKIPELVNKLSQKLQLWEKEVIESDIKISE